MPTSAVELTIFRGRAGDRNDSAMRGAVLVGEFLASRLELNPVKIGSPELPLRSPWDVELNAALPSLHNLSLHYRRILLEERRPLTTMGRCAAALATLPIVARRHPDAAIVWFDAHADSNTPETTTTGYLGGLVLTGAAGLWFSGLGNELNLSNVILVGSRDIDLPEQNLLDHTGMKLVPPGPRLPEQLLDAVGGREVYIHLDCDVLNPGLIPVELEVEGGLSFDDLNEAAQTLAQLDVLGLEISEFEAKWPHAQQISACGHLIDALEPLTSKLCHPMEVGL